MKFAQQPSRFQKRTGSAGAEAGGSQIPTRPRSAAAGQEGIALFIVLVLVVVLTIVIFQLTFTTKIEERISRNRQGFLSLFRLLLRQSGGQLDYSQLANLSELSRPTVKNHIEAMQIAHAVHLLRPFHGGGKREIVSRPKCYAFDTGFVTFEKGWDSIRDDDRGVLWEHLVLDTLRFRFADEDIFYWQDKSHREVDFVIPRGRDRVDVMECNINPDKLDAKPVEAFRDIYPQGNNYIVSPSVKKPYQVRRGDRVFTVCSTRDLPE